MAQINDLFRKDLFLMYNKENIRNLFHETPLGLPESMEQKDYYRTRILDLHHDLKERGIVSHTNPTDLPDLSEQPSPAPSQTP